MGFIVFFFNANLAFNDCLAAFGNFFGCHGANWHAIIQAFMQYQTLFQLMKDIFILIELRICINDMARRLKQTISQENLCTP